MAGRRRRCVLDHAETRGRRGACRADLGGAAAVVALRRPGPWPLVLDWSDRPHFIPDVRLEWLAGVNLALPVTVSAESGGSIPGSTAWALACCGGPPSGPGGTIEEAVVLSTLLLAGRPRCGHADHRGGPFAASARPPSRGQGVRSPGTPSNRQSVAEIWNGTAAQDIRRSIRDVSFEYCNPSRCPHLQTFTDPVQKTDDVTEPKLRRAIRDRLTVVRFWGRVSPTARTTAPAISPARPAAPG
jgi:hypothetical protein